MLFTALLMGCAGAPYAVRIRCGEPPIMLPVAVHDGALTPDEVEKVVQNHLKLWEYIHINLKLGCTF